MLHRPFAALAAVAVALALAACGGGAEEVAAPVEVEAAEQAAVLVTRDCGAEIVVPRAEVEAGQTALQALDSVAEIESEGGLVTAIEGVEQDVDEMLAWLFYVNGEMAEVGAAEVRLEAGDVEWWDLHDWEETCQVPDEAS